MYSHFWGIIMIKSILIAIKLCICYICNDETASNYTFLQRVSRTEVSAFGIHLFNQDVDVSYIFFIVCYTVLWPWYGASKVKHSLSQAIHPIYVSNSITSGNEWPVTLTENLITKTAVKWGFCTLAKEAKWITFN